MIMLRNLHSRSKFSGWLRYWLDVYISLDGGDRYLDPAHPYQSSPTKMWVRHVRPSFEDYIKHGRYIPSYT
jgi:hypothetical protein